uniref:Uncharacterized protein n=1 Tax=Glossina palpalis gambiensis TaxID=67801 RepID=A0A1B0B7H5_9MUSC
MLTAEIVHNWNLQFRLLIALVCMVSSRMRINVMSSGTAGTVNHLDINVLPVWLMIAMLAFVCGLIKCPNAEMKKLPMVSLALRPVNWPILVHSQDMLTLKIAVNITFA